MLEIDNVFAHLTGLEEDSSTAFGQAKRSRDLQRELLVSQLSPEVRGDFYEFWTAERVFRRLELEAVYQVGVQEGVRLKRILISRKK